MKIICGDRGQGKTSYILQQCKSLPGTKLILTHSEFAAKNILSDIIHDETLKDLVTVMSIWHAGQNRMNGLDYDYVFIDNLDATLEGIIRDYIGVRSKNDYIATINFGSIQKLLSEIISLTDAIILTKDQADWQEAMLEMRNAIERANEDS